MSDKEDVRKDRLRSPGERFTGRPSASTRSSCSWPWSAAGRSLAGAILAVLALAVLRIFLDFFRPWLRVRR